MRKAEAVPALVKVKDVGVASPEASVKAIFLPVVVEIVLPWLYASCKEMPDAFAGHWTISVVVSSRHNVEADTGAPGRLPSCTVLPKIISPVPAETLKFAFDCVPISVVAPVNTRPVDPIVLLESVWA